MSPLRACSSPLRLAGYAESMVPAPPQLAAKSYVPMDGESGQVWLDEQRRDQRRRRPA
ncbi:hypothetical protein ACPA9J_34395 [Pseudomonas aeruginosa]